MGSTTRLTISPYRRNDWRSVMLISAANLEATNAGVGMSGSKSDSGKPLRRAVRTVGEILITAGVVLLLFVGWQLWWTDILAGRAQAQTRDQLEQQWQSDGPIDTDTVDTDIKTEYGEPFGLLYVPRLGDRAWKVPIIQGTEHSLLANGVGHHVNSALPGQLGNFAIAGHRTTYGAPFADIDALKPGDEVVVETRKGWFIYELDRDKIISATDGWVLDPVPGRPAGSQPRQALLTMYACHPKYSAAERYVWFGELRDEIPRSSGKPVQLNRAGN
ncbi:MAG: class E sortase [Micrococcales bacterium]|nr:class E sortase [Micrococcales bacterium]